MEQDVVMSTAPTVTPSVMLGKRRREETGGEESSSIESGPGLVPASSRRTRKAGPAPVAFKDTFMQAALEELRQNYNAPNPYPKMSSEWRKWNLVKARIARADPSKRRAKRARKPAGERGKKSIVSAAVRSNLITRRNGRTVRMRIGKQARDQLAGISQDRAMVQRAALVAARSAEAGGRATVKPRDVAVARACLA